MNDLDMATMGRPGDDVTHWRIVRHAGGKPEDLDWPTDGGLRLTEWPIAELSLAEIRRRWGSGTFQVQYMTIDASNPDAKKRRQPKGRGAKFTIEAPKVEAPPPSPALPVGVGADAMGQAMKFAATLLEMTDRRTQEQLRAVAELAGRSPSGASPAADAVAELRAELAAMRAQQEADRQRRELEDRHRAELAAKDRELAELRADQDREPEEPALQFEPGAPLLEQLAFGVLNAAAKMPAETVERLVSIVAPIFVKPQPQATPPALVTPPPTGPAIPYRGTGPIHAPPQDDAPAWPSTPIEASPPPPSAWPTQPVEPPAPPAATTSNGVPVREGHAPAKPAPEAASS